MVDELAGAGTAHHVAANQGRRTSRPKRTATVRAVSGYKDLIGPLAILLCLVLVFSFAADGFATGDNLRSIANQAAVPLVLATGLTFVILMGSIDLSAEGVVALTSMVVSLSVANTVNGTDLGNWALAVGLGIGVLSGLINGLLYTYLRLPSLIVTLGTWFIALGIASYLFPDQQPVIDDPAFRDWAFGKWFGVSQLVTVAVVFAIAGHLLLKHTKLGRNIYGIGAAEDLMRLAGINVRAYKVAAFALAGMATGLAALMITAQLGVGSPASGDGRLFPAISAVVLGGTLLSGGKGGVAHSAVGVLILGVLANGMILLGVDPYLQQGVTGIVIIAAVVFATLRSRSRLKVVK